MKGGGAQAGKVALGGCDSERQLQAALANRRWHPVDADPFQNKPNSWKPELPLVIFNLYPTL